MKKILLCLALISMLTAVTILSACHGAAGSAALSPAQVVDAFYQACKSRSYDTAKSFLSPASINYFNAQEQQDPNRGFKAFADYCATNMGAPEFVSLRAENERITNNSALVDTAFAYRDNEPIFVPHHLVRDNGWQLDMVSTFEQLPPEAPRGDYREELSRSGRWLRHPKYGDVWRPSDVGYNWQPYCNDGNFVRSEDGWEWNSERPWGDRVFHYGRWAQTVPWGWVWVPDASEQYSPAWVNWRANDEYVGWTPMAPGINLDNQPSNYNPPTPSWVFVPTRTFVETVTRSRPVRYQEARVPYNNYSNIISSSKPYWGCSLDNGRVVNRGIDVGYLERIGGVSIRQVASRRVIDRRVVEIERNIPPGHRNNGLYGVPPGHGGLPPGHGGIPPGQAKKYGYGYDKHEEKEWRKHEKDWDKHERKLEKEEWKAEKKHWKQEEKEWKHENKGHGNGHGNGHGKGHGKHGD